MEEQLYTKAKVAKGRERRAAGKTLSADRALAWPAGSPGLDSRYKAYAVVHTCSPTLMNSERQRGQFPVVLTT